MNTQRSHPAVHPRLSPLGTAAVVALAVVAILTWVLASTTVKAPSNPDPVPHVAAKNELTWRGDALFLGEETEPFTGVMLDSYPSGSPRSRCALVHGRLHGVSEGWYTNGVLQVREEFHDGISHGLRTKWFPDGSKLSEAPIEHGKIHGTFRRWHENGRLAEEIEMTAGVPNGMSRLFHPSGALKAEARVEHGNVLERHTWKDGEASASIAALNPQREP